MSQASKQTKATSLLLAKGSAAPWGWDWGLFPYRRVMVCLCFILFCFVFPMGVVFENRANEMKITKAPGGQTPTGNSSGSPFVWGLCSSRTQSPPSLRHSVSKQDRGKDALTKYQLPTTGPLDNFSLFLCSTAPWHLDYSILQKRKLRKLTYFPG